MLEVLIAVAVLVALVRYVYIAMSREVIEEVDTDPLAALDSIRAALPVEVRESDFAPLADADRQVSRRPRVPAITSPLPTLKGSK